MRTSYVDGLMTVPSSVCSDMVAEVMMGGVAPGYSHLTGVDSGTEEYSWCALGDYKKERNFS